MGDNEDPFCYSDTPKEIIHDKKAISLIIFVLLANSVKYTSRGEIVIKIKYKTKNKELKIIILDSGIGINPEQQLHLFQLYGQALNSEFGIGIGLNLSKKIAESLGGSIKLESEEHVGTKVTVKVPCQLPPIEEILPFAGSENEIVHTTFSNNSEGNVCDLSLYLSKRATPSKQAFDSWKEINRYPNPQRHILEEEKTTAIFLNNIDFHKAERYNCNCAQILIVDDMNSNILVLKGLLRLLGLKADEAEDGLKAIRKMREAKESRNCCGNYQVILMDCNMPIMNGYEATVHIRELIHANIINPCLVIGVTAYNSSESKILCHQAGMTDVIFKPVSKSMLINLCHKYSIT